MKQHQILKVSGMSCSHCTGAVKNAIEQYNSVENVTVNLERGVAEFDFDPAVNTLEVIIAAVEDEGFEADLPFITTHN